LATTASVSLTRSARAFAHVFLLVCISGASPLLAQTKPANPYYARVNSFGVFGAYSADSSHILLGAAENRELLEIGVSYSRRLFLNRILNWQYNTEFLPVALESDPKGHEANNQTEPTVMTTSFVSPPPVSCAPITVPYAFTNPDTGVTYSGTDTFSCQGRRWTMGEAVSPIGFQWNFLTHRKTQPFLIGHGGYMYSTKQIPIDNAGSFNFTFDFGAGFEIYRSKNRSIRAEFRYHHISNHNTAQLNPGIDNGLLQVTYSFGK
jgi:opacity protein-like surface antigen